MTFCLTFDSVCKDCPDRKVGCHNVETCSKWAEHENTKDGIYADRLRESTLRAIEQSRLRKCYRAIEAKRNK